MQCVCTDTQRQSLNDCDSVKLLMLFF
jgi:hypothetical protein